MTDKYLVDTDGEMDEIEPGRRDAGTDARRHVRFPVRLSVRYGRALPLDFSNFILNISKGGVFIETGRPLEVGAEIVIHIYIPPDVKLLGEFKGRVVWVNTEDRSRPLGMGIKFIGDTHRAMSGLVSLLEEKRHLIDCAD